MIDQIRHKRPVVAHILGSLERGGAEHRILALLQDPATSDEFDTAILLMGTQDFTRQALYQAFLDAGATVSWIGKNPIRVAGKLRSKNYAAVHSHVHLASGWILAVVAFFSPSARRIAHIRSTSSDRKGIFLRPLYEALMRRCLILWSEEIVAVSHSAMEGTFGLGWRRHDGTKVIYNGVPIPSSPLRPDSVAEIRLSVVGRFGPQKNQRHSIRVAEELAKQRVVALTLFGRGSSEELEVAAAAAQSDRLQIRVVSEQPMESILAKTDVLLAPSLREGLPGVVLEAIAAGVPVVASDIGPMQEVQSHLPSVHTLPLEATQTWPPEILVALDDKADDLRREFKLSPFSLSESHAAIRNCWRAEL